MPAFVYHLMLVYFAVEFGDAEHVGFVDVGNSYFYSRRMKVTQSEANKTCMSYNMRLVEVQDSEEMSVLVDGVSQFQSELVGILWPYTCVNFADTFLTQQTTPRTLPGSGQVTSTTTSRCTTYLVRSRVST